MSGDVLPTARQFPAAANDPAVDHSRRHAMKHLLLAGACALVLASAPAFAQSSPNTLSPSASSPSSPSPSVTSPSVTSPSSPSTSSGPCAAGQVLQANGQPCSPS